MVVQNNAPSSAATRCPLQWLRPKYGRPNQSKLQFLDILDDLTHRDLLPIQAEYPRRDNLQPRELDYKGIQETYLYKLMYGRQFTKNSWKQLFEVNTGPKMIRSVPNSARPSTLKKTKGSARFIDKFSTQNYLKREICKKLSPYIFESHKPEGTYGRPMVVMPVRVYYENFKANEPPTKLKNPSKSSLGNKKVLMSHSKDLEGLKKAKWSTQGVPRPMKIVYDSLPKKTEIPTRDLPVIKSSITNRKTTANSARFSVDIKPIDKIESRSFSPKRFSEYCDNMENIEKEPIEVRHEQNVTIYSKIQEDIEKIKGEIHSKQNNTDRKLWEHKYGKSVGKKLISFVQNQSPAAASPRPKYAMPKTKIQNIPSNFTEKRNVHSFLKQIQPHKEMLLQVQNLKNKNNSIQNNIKKAIDVIETKMVDILCDESSSVDAFNTMEKEITNVLNLMKSDGKKIVKPTKSLDRKVKIEPNPVKDKNTSLDTDYNIISNQLFERLQKILDTGPATETGTVAAESTRSKQHKKGKDATKKKQKLTGARRQKISLLSSSSASLDEQLTRRSPKHSSKKSEKSGPKTDLCETHAGTTQSNLEIWANSPCDQDTPVAEKPIEHNKTGFKVSNDQLPQNDKDFVEQDATENKDICCYIEAENASADNTNDQAEKLTLEDKSEIPDHVSEVIKDSNVNKPIDEFINEEITKAIDIEEVLQVSSNYNEDIEDPVKNTEIEFIAEEISKVIEKVETLAAVPDYLKNESVEDAEIEEYINDELEAVIEKATTSEVPEPIKNTQESTAMDVGIEKVINNESNKAIENAEALVAASDCIQNKSIINPEMEEFINDEINKVMDSIIVLSEETGLEKLDGKTHIDYPKLENQQSSSYSTASSEMDEFDAKLRSESTTNFSNQVNKIIRRVEDIYSQLDDIQNSDSVENIPVFKEVDLAEVRSEIFLTPFMQAVKENTKCPKDDNKMSLIERSPSYYNVMSFLDTLTNIQKEVPYEIHIARLYHYGYVYRRAEIYYRVEIWHEVQYSNSPSGTSYVKRIAEEIEYSLSQNEKTGCLRKISEERYIKTKKVSFFDKDDKSSQVTLCPFHKMKMIRISSQQFPPVENLIQNELQEKISVPNTYQIVAVHKTAPIDKYALSQKYSQHKCSRSTQDEEDYEKTKGTDLSSIDDKSTQVFCQMLKEENSIDSSTTDQNACMTSNNEPSSDYPGSLEDNGDDSKSTEKDFLEDSFLDPFYDYTNDNITPMGVIQNIEGIYEEDKPKSSGQTQPKVVVFREVVEEPSSMSPLRNIDCDIQQYKKRLEKRKKMRLMRKSSMEIVRREVQKVRSSNDNVVLLKSFYAIVYILMFTALSLDYRCL